MNSELPFQRLPTVAGNVTENVEEMYKFELCRHPSSSIDLNGLVREANNPLMADDSIWNVGASDRDPCTKEMRHVVDGGSLVQQRPWKRCATLDCICNS